MGGRMRLLSVFIATAILTCGLVAAFGYTAAVAQEQNNAGAQASAGCQGPEVVGTVGPTDKDLVIGPFAITGKTFRLVYETTDADESGFPFFDVTVLDAARNQVGGQVIFDEGTRTEIVRGGPGSFTIEARAEDLKYKLTAEDCTGSNSGGPNPAPGGGGVDQRPVPEGQYKSDVDPPNENNVIDNTVSDKPLPNTGGVPLLGFLGFVCVSAAFALLGPMIRRDI